MPGNTDRQFLDASWKRWIAENVLKGNSPEELITILIQNGFSENLARLEVGTACEHPYVDAARSVARQLAKRDWLLNTIRELRDSDGSFTIAERAEITTAEFKAQFYEANRPLILRGFLTRWPAVQTWTPELLKERCGDLQVEVQARRSSNPDFELQPQLHRESHSFAEFVDYCFADSVSNDKYMTARNGASNQDVLRRLQSDFDAIPEFLDASRASRENFLWIGPKGTITPLHHDLTNNMMAQVVGEKKIRLVSPDSLPFMYNHLHVYSEVSLASIDVQRFPLFGRVHIIDVVIRPGDLFFLPVGWWHHVESLSTSITITCTNFLWPNDFSQSYTTYGQI